MKRCQKCNRTYPDENQKFCTIDGGLLVSAEQAFDPNATMQGSASNMGYPVATPVNEDTVDLNATIATSLTAETAVLPRNTGPTGSATFANQPAPPATEPPPVQSAATVALTPPPPAQRPSQPSAPLPSAPLPTAPVAGNVAANIAAKKKSKLPLILGVLALLLVLGLGGVVALYFMVIKPRLVAMNPDGLVITNTNRGTDENVNNNTPSNTNTAENVPPTTSTEFTPPAGSVKFENSKANLDGKLAEHYLDFSFYYPQAWALDPKAGVAGATNFAKVERRLPPDFTQENLAVGWYESKGTVAADESSFPRLVERLNATFSTNLPGYRKVSEGPTKVNSLDGYEFRFEGLSKGTDKGDIQLWGRVIFLPPGVEGETNGATLSMLTTSLAPELTGVEDVGKKGEMPLILESFRFGKKP